MKTLLKPFILLAIFSFLLSSCSVSRMRYSKGLNIEWSVFSKNKGKSEKIKSTSSKNQPQSSQARGEEIPTNIEAHSIANESNANRIEIDGNKGIQSESISGNKRVVLKEVEIEGFEPVIQQDLEVKAKGNHTTGFNAKVTKSKLSKPTVRKSKSEDVPLTGAFGIIGFVLSLLGLLCILVSVLIALVLLILGIVFSAKGMGKGRPNRDLGIAGLVIGIVGILLLALFIMYIFWVLLYLL